MGNKYLLLPTHSLGHGEEDHTTLPMHQDSRLAPGSRHITAMGGMLFGLSALCVCCWVDSGRKKCLGEGGEVEGGTGE